MEADLQARLEVRDGVEAMIENLGPIVGRNPATITKAGDFNALLERARSAFPQSVAIRDMPKVEDGGVTLFDLLSKLSILKGAVRADFAARNYAAAEGRPRMTGRGPNPLLDR
jgi:hypothetical protein